MNNMSAHHSQNQNSAQSHDWSNLLGGQALLPTADSGDVSPRSLPRSGRNEEGAAEIEPV